MLLTTKLIILGGAGIVAFLGGRYMPSRAKKWVFPEFAPVPTQELLQQGQRYLLVFDQTAIAMGGLADYAEARSLFEQAERAAFATGHGLFRDYPLVSTVEALRVFKGTRAQDYRIAVTAGGVAWHPQSFEGITVLDWGRRIARAWSAQIPWGGVQLAGLYTIPAGVVDILPPGVLTDLPGSSIWPAVKWAGVGVTAFSIWQAARIFSPTRPDDEADQPAGLRYAPPF